MEIDHKKCDKDVLKIEIGHKMRKKIGWKLKLTQKSKVTRRKQRDGFRLYTYRFKTSF